MIEHTEKEKKIDKSHFNVAITIKGEQHSFIVIRVKEEKKKISSICNVIVARFYFRDEKIIGILKMKSEIG